MSVKTKKENMEKRLILAITLSILIIVSFQYLFVKPSVEASRRAAQAQTGEPARAPETNFTITPQPPSPDEKETVVETDKYLLTFSNIGGAIKEIDLKDYKAADGNGPFVLAKTGSPREYILSINDNWEKLSDRKSVV